MTSNLEDAVRNSLSSATFGAFVGYALGKPVLPYASAYAILPPISMIVKRAINQAFVLDSKSYSDKWLDALLSRGISFTVASAGMRYVGLATAPNVLLCATALTVYSLFSSISYDNKYRSSHYVIVSISFTVLTASSFGWNPLIFAIIGAAAGIAYANHKNFDFILSLECYVGKVNSLKLKELVAGCNGASLAISALKRSPIGIAASIGFFVLCTFATKKSAT